MADLSTTPLEQVGLPAPPASPAGDRLMTLGEHLGELRRRLAISILAVGAGTIVGLFLAPDAIAILAEPIPGPLYFTEPAGAFMLYLKLAIMIGLALGFPVLLYQVWAFIAPGLTERERRLARPWIPLATFFLVLGVVLAYTVLPYAAAFLLGFQIGGVIQPLITTEAYFGFVTTMFIAFALVLQMPVALILLARAGIVGSQRLRRSRRYVLLGVFIVAVVVTPSDPFSSIIITLVIYPLYELSIYLAARTERARAAAHG
jgi:sec-independent protein translocase protein TatC